MRLQVAVLLIAATLPCLGEKFSLDHFSSLAQISNLKITSDGKVVLAVISRGNLKENRFDQELVRIQVSDGTHTVLARGAWDSLGVIGAVSRGTPSPNLNQAQLSPAGDQVAYLVPVNGAPQIFLVPVNGGAAVQLTRTPTRVNFFAWRPDGKAIAYLAPVSGKNQLFVKLLADSEPLQRSQASHPITSFSWAPDGSKIIYAETEDHFSPRDPSDPLNRSFEADTNYLSTSTNPPSTVTLFLTSASAGEPRRLNSLKAVLRSSLLWSPDSRRVLIQHRPQRGARYNLQVKVEMLDTETGKLSLLHTDHPEDNYAHFSPDGKYLLFKRPHNGFASTHLWDWWVESVPAASPRNLTGAHEIFTGYSTSGAQWLPGNQQILVTGLNGTSSGFWLFKLDGSSRRLDLGDLQVELDSVEVSQSGAITFVASKASAPQELYYMADPSSTPLQISAFNAPIARLELGKGESLTWKSSDGFEADGVLVYPPDYQSGKAYPLVLEIHGGPQDASILDFHAQSQWLAAQGWIVFRPNYRGSVNRGGAYQAAVRNDAGAGPARDIMSGVDLLVRRGVADPGRMAVSGGSYGGHMAVWLLAHYPDRWRSGVVLAALVDHIDQYVLSFMPPQVKQQFGGSPFDNPERLKAYREQSPITYAHQIKAPTLILHATGDLAVPITQGYLLHHVLTDNNIPNQFIAYPLTAHRPFDPVHSRDVQRRWVEWIKRNFE